MKKKQLLFLFPFIISLFGCKGNYSTYSKNILAYSTTININLYKKNKDDYDKHLNYLTNLYKEYARLAEYNYSFKDTYSVANVYDINNQPLNEPLEISKELYDLLKTAISYYDITDGNFNIAIGHASYKWKECIDSSVYVDLNQYILDNGYELDITGISLSDEGYYVTRTKDVLIDLGGIAKGYVNNLALNYLKENNIDNYLINAGNSSIIIGKHPDDRDFRVGLINPTKVSENYTVLEASNVSVTTSGDYESSFTYNNQFYHHILSPELDNKYYYHSLSVITTDACLGDVLSTALFNLKIEDALAMCEKLDVDAIFYLNDGSIIKTEGFNYEKA